MSRQVVRLGVPVAVLGLLALGPSTHADVEPGSGLSSYSLAASAPGLALEGLYKDVALTVPETTSSLTTGGVGASLAALGWPGPVIGNAGTTILVLQPTAPSQVSMLNDPVKAQARTAGPQQSTFNTLPGTVMSATARPDEVTASSETGTGTTLPVGTVGAVSASSEVGLRGATTAVASSRSAVQHLSLAGGVIQVGSVVSTVTATSDGQVASSKGSTTVSGLTIAGVAVAVDDKGIHLAGQDAANPVPVKAVSDAVKALGLTVVLTEPREVRQGGSVRYTGSALVLVFSQGGQEVAVTLGRASATIEASRAPDLPTGTDGQAGGGGAPVPPSTGVAPPAALGSTTSTPTVDSPSFGPSLPAPVAAVVGALAPVAALALASGAPLPLALVLLLGGAMVALLLSRLPGLLLVVPATDCEDSA